MDCVTITTELLNCEQRLYSVPKKDYQLDFWRELRKRWMILGVLLAMTLAVLSPKVGAYGGPLHTEYLSYLPLTCIYYLAGRRARGGAASARAAALSAAHAHAGPPAVLAAAAAWLEPAVPGAVVKGALLSSVGAPCAWLSLVAARDVGTALVLLTVNYVTSLVAAPVAMFFICGRAPLPALGPPLRALACALPALAAGAAHSRVRPAPRSRRAERLCSLALLYVEVCERTAAAGAGLRPGDVLATLVLALWCVCGGALACAASARVLLRAPAAGDARALAVCAVPKAMDAGWETSIDCVPSGLSRLPAVFLVPAQALLLAAIADYEDEETQMGDRLPE